MEKPKINIDGNEKEIGRISAGVGSEIFKLEKEFPNMPPTEFIDRICAALSKVYEVSADELLDAVAVEDILKKYFEVYNYVIYLLFPNEQAE